MTDNEQAALTSEQAFVVSRGEMSEASEVIGVYSTYEKAAVAMRLYAEKLNNRPYSQIPYVEHIDTNGRASFIAGIDYLSIDVIELDAPAMASWERD